MRILLNSRLLLVLILILAFGLRFYKLGMVPISLHGDEVGVGYNAYSLLTAGIDEYGKSWPLTFRADVAPMIFYVTLPTIALFGATDFAVRFPSLIVGSLTILFFYFLTFELFNQNKRMALLATFLLAISPWHVQISRIAHDGSYGLLLQIVGIWLFLRGIRLNKHWLLYISVTFFGLSFYAYHSPRLTTPLIILGLVFFFRERLKNIKQEVLLSGILFVLIITPMVLDIVNKPLAETRFGGINVFIRQPGDSIVTLPFKLVGNYLQQFSPTPLFFDSSSTRYFNVQNVGLLYAIELPLILAGMFYIFKHFKQRWLLLYLLLISVSPGALTLGPMNGGRVILLLPISIWLSAVGLYSLNKKTKILFASFYLILVPLFLYQYFVDSPLRFYTQWQYGVKQIAQFVTEHESEVKKIIISDELRQAYAYVLFYGKKSPVWLNNTANKERHSFIGYSAFDIYEYRHVEEDESLSEGFVVLSLDQFKMMKPEQIIYGPDQKPIYKIVRF